jgi:hypothetical protein
MANEHARTRSTKICFVFDDRLGTHARDRVRAVLQELGGVAVPSAAPAELIVACLSSQPDAAVVQDLLAREKPLITFRQTGSGQNDAARQARSLFGARFSDVDELPGLVRRRVERFLGAIARQPESDVPTAPPAPGELVLFVSSPSDLERFHGVIREAVELLNQRRAARSEPFLSVRFGGDLPSEVRAKGGSPQGVINDRLPMASVDILIGMMWHRCGTPTATADSGTIEEVQNGLSLQASTGLPWVCFYRCDVEIPPREIDLDQQAKVNRFLDDLEHRGIVRAFKSQAELQLHIARDLPEIVPKVVKIKLARGMVS